MKIALIILTVFLLTGCVQTRIVYVDRYITLSDTVKPCDLDNVIRKNGAIWFSYENYKLYGYLSGGEKCLIK